MDLPGLDVHVDGAPATSADGVLHTVGTVTFELRIV